MNIGQALGLFLSLWKHVEGKHNAETLVVPFPGTRESWTAQFTDTSQDILARFHILASLSPDKTAERAFNVADGPPTAWEREWPALCEYFGLRGGGPEERQFSAQQWMESHQSAWADWVREYGLKEGALEATSWEFMQVILSIPFRRDYDLSAARQVGFTDQRETYLGYVRCFDEMRNARIIP